MWRKFEGASKEHDSLSKEERIQEMGADQEFRRYLGHLMRKSEGVLACCKRGRGSPDESEAEASVEYTYP
jgi:hypothetical protein